MKYPLLRQLPGLLILHETKELSGCRSGNCKMLLTLEFLSNSRTRLSYGANPTTSLTTDLTNWVFLDNLPFRWLGLIVLGMAVVS